MTPDKSTLTSILPPVLLAAAVHTAFLAVYVLAYGGDLSALICVSEKKIGEWPFKLVRVGFPTDGYDGQFYYALAQNPWSLQSWDLIDFPPFRHLRILYPALAWLFSGGNPALLFWVMPAINVVAIAGLAWCGALLAVHYHRSSWWGFVLPLVVNAGMPALRDLTDPLATATLFAMLAAYLLEWSVGRLTLWAIAAVLSREQNVAILLVVLGEALLERRWLQGGALAAVLFLWCGWFVNLRIEYGVWPVAARNLSYSLSGIGYGLTHLMAPYKLASIARPLGMLLILLQISICGMLLFQQTQRLTAFIALAGVTLALMGGVSIYRDHWSYMRIFIWMPLAIWLWSMQSGRKWPVIALTPIFFLLLGASIRPWIKS